MVVTVRLLCGAYHFTVPTVNFVTVITVLLNRFTMRPNCAPIRLLVRFCFWFAFRLW
jgi:hypothetical protein